MQFNLVNDQEQVAQFVGRGVAWCSVALRGVSITVYCGGWGVPEALVAWVFIGPWGACPGRFRAVLAISGSFAY